MGSAWETQGLGTRMRHVLELLDGEVARFDKEIGLDDYRPRFSPAVRALVAEGPLPIRDLAKAMAVTHSAASQTIAQMAKRDLVTLEPGVDARQRIVSLTAKTRALLPTLEREWKAVTEAADGLEAELPHSLSGVLTAILEALDRKPFLTRITETAEGRRLL